MSLIFAHRGCQTKAPENSLQAFKNAVELGVYGIELDVQMTKDKEIVVHHKLFLRERTIYWDQK